MTNNSVVRTIDRQAFRAKTDVWVECLGLAFGSWDVPKHLDRDFGATLKLTRYARTNLIECRCDSNSGRRDMQLIKSNDEPQIGVQLVVDGTEHFSFADKRATAKAGDLILWSSLEPMTFEIPEHLHKLTIMLPERTLSRWLPKHYQLRGEVLNTQSGTAAVLRKHMHALIAHSDEFSEQDRFAVETASLELIAGLVKSRSGGECTMISGHKLNRVQRFVLENLEDGALNLTVVARENDISVRYLHSLFRGIGTTPRAWIQEQRLLKTREALLGDVNRKRMITDIAFACGFSDSAHFSRSFHKRFGLSPREFRANLNP